MADPTPSGKPRGSLFAELKRRHVVRVGVAYAAMSWLLLQLGDILFPAFGAPVWATRLLFGFLVLGFPVALLLAWAFELTPEGVRRTEPAHSAEVQPSVQRRRIGSTLNTVTIVVLGAAVAVLGWRQFVDRLSTGPSGAESLHGVSRAPAVSAHSIAVLPLANGNGDSATQYFSDGLSEELIVALSQSPKLEVIGRESSFQFRGKDLDSKVVGRKLGVTHLLEGSVTREGGRVRVLAELVSTADGRTLWSAQFDRPYRDLFALQDDLTKAVATALEARLLGNLGGTAVPQSDRPPGGSVAAYNAFLEGNFYFRRLSDPDLRRAIGDYGTAIRLDPRYAAAFAARSHAWADLGLEFRTGAARQQAFDSARAAADTAVALDPSLAAGHDSRGIVLRFDLKWDASEAEFRRAVELAPGDVDAERYAASALATAGRLEKAVALQRKAVKADPLDGLGFGNLSLYLAAEGRYDDAAEAMRHALSLQPGLPGAHAALAEIEVLRGDTAAALEDARADPRRLSRVWAFALVYASAGHTALLDAALDTLIRERKAGQGALAIASVYALRRKPEQVFSWLDRAWQERTPGVAALMYSPLLLRYRDDPRFAAFCRKVGLPVPGARDSGAGAESPDTAGP